MSASRNPNLVQLFFRMHLTESYGTGVGKIQRNYAGVNTRPVLDTAPGMFRVTLPNVNETAVAQKLPEIELVEAVENEKSIDYEKRLHVQYVTENNSITQKEAEDLLEVGIT